MKYRKSVFLSLLVLALVSVYAQPIIYPIFTSKSLIAPTKSKQLLTKSTNTSYQPIAAEGFARLIGEDLEKFETIYGKPVEKLTTGFSYDIQIYYANEQHGYMEVSTEAEKIVGIKLIGQQKKSDQLFTFDMDMGQLTKLTTIYPNFTLSYENQAIDIELNEEDMNYRPLVAFDNETFAILFFDQVTSKVHSVMYLSKELLLKLAPYSMEGEVVPRFVKEKAVEWPVADNQKELFTRNIFNMLRKKDHLPIYQHNLNLQLATKQLLTQFLTNPSDSLTTQRVQLLQKIMANQTREKFAMSSDESKTLLNKFSLSQSDLYVELPIYDPSFTILTWYSSSFLHTRFMEKKEEALAIAFTKENMVVLLQAMQTTHKESDDK